MAEKYGVATSQEMEEVRECSSYHEAVRLAASGHYIVVFYDNGQWWF